MATNRPDTLDPALMRPGRLDRKVEFGVPDLDGRTHIFKIHARSMSVERDIRFELLARLCPNSTGKYPKFKGPIHNQSFGGSQGKRGKFDFILMCLLLLLQLQRHYSTDLA